MFEFSENERDVCAAKRAGIGEDRAWRVVDRLCYDAQSFTLRIKLSDVHGSGRESLEIDYAHLLENPREDSERIAQFAKIDPEKIEIMAAVIDPSLRLFGAAAQAV